MTATKKNTMVRTRFAPSPTGPLHIGGARSAIFSWLLARRFNGQFILRLEDTDRKRFVPGSDKEIYEGLRWLGLDWDEGPDVGGPFVPYVQTERKKHYQEVSKHLIKLGHAYPCFCTTERIAEVNQRRRARGEPGGYDRHCRDIAPTVASRRVANGESFVVRMKTPLFGKTEGFDLIRGSLFFENERLQDTVLLKSDGLPTYHLAVVVDDHAMHISHVTRAVEWLSSFPIHVLLWQMLEWQMPKFAHLPVLLNPNGKGKLSKRHAGFQLNGQSVPVLLREFQSEGFYGPAVANFLTNIGWSFGDDREIFNLLEAAERFDVARVNAANSAFPIDKLRWLNGVYIRELLTRSELASWLKSPLRKAGLNPSDELLDKVTPLIQPRIKTFTDVVKIAGFFFEKNFKPPSYELLSSCKLSADEIFHVLQESKMIINSYIDLEARVLHEKFIILAKSLNQKNGPIFAILRISTTGQSVSPPTFETMEILGKEECLRRIDLAMNIVSRAMPMENTVT